MWLQQTQKNESHFDKIIIEGRQLSFGGYFGQTRSLLFLTNSTYPNAGPPPKPAWSPCLALPGHLGWVAVPHQIGRPPLHQ